MNSLNCLSRSIFLFFLKILFWFYPIQKLVEDAYPSNKMRLYDLTDKRYALTLGTGKSKTTENLFFIFFLFNFYNSF